MAIIDNTLAAQMPTFDTNTYLAKAAQIKNAEIEQQQQQFKLAQAELGSEARGLQTYVNSPEFPQRWAETVDRLAQKGVLPPQTAQQWRNQPSPLMLKSIIAQTEDPALSFRKQEAGRNQGNTDRDAGFKARELDIRERALNQRAPNELERRAQAGGLVPGTPQYQEFMLRGGRNSDVTPSVTEKKEIFKSEDELPNIQGTIEALQSAKALNSKTFTGITAGARGFLGSSVPGGDYLVDRDSALATTEWNKVMSGEAIKTMADTLKGATTDFELKKFESMLADPTTPPEIRGRVIDRMISLAERQRRIKERRIRELPGGSYFKPEGSRASTTGPTSPTREIPQAAIEALRTNPDLKADFEEKYGKGTAATVLK